MRELECALQNLIAPRLHASKGRRHADVDWKPDALELATVRMAHIIPSEHHVQAAWQREIRYVAVRASALAADELGPGRNLEEEPRVLGLADGALVDEHEGLAAIERFRRRR